MISLNKCTGSCNVLSPKIYVPKEAKDINVKGFNMKTNKDEAKTMTEHVSCDCKCKFNSTTCSSNQKWNNKSCQCECKNYRKCKKYYCGILAHVFVKIVFKRCCRYFSDWVWWNYKLWIFYQQKKQILQQQLLQVMLQYIGKVKSKRLL